MSYSLKMKWVAFAASFFSIVAVGNADQNASCNSDCAPICGRWSVISDTLYLTACQGGLSFGSETRADVAGGSIGNLSSYHTKLKHPHSQWDFGWRLGVGYESKCGCWNGNLIWTHFNTNSHAKHEEPASANQWFTPAWGGIAVLGTPPDQLLGGNVAVPLGFPVDEAFSHWKLQLNMVDLEIGREFCVNSCLKLRPHIGVRGASINEKNKIKYKVDAVTGGLPPGELGQTILALETIATDKFHLKNDFEGAGVRAGLDTTYDLGCGVSLYGTVAASLLYGETEIETKEKFIAGSEINSNIYVQKQKDNDCGCRAITDASIGISWENCCFKRVFVTKIGWEHHFFFNENQFEKFTNFNGTDNAATDRMPQVLHGDLSIQGLVWSTVVYF
jgi:hypothetical protein